MEDWEQFFVEKSRRRFEKERQAQRQQRIAFLIGGLVIGLIIVGGLVAIAMQG